MATESGVSYIISIIHSGHYPKQITRKFKTISLHPAPYILSQKQ
jgi:hypothetical protein